MSTYAVTNPATGEVVDTYPQITDAELADAIARANSVTRGWGRTSSVEERAAIVSRIGDLHEERRDELAHALVEEMGKPLAQAYGEVDFAADIYRYHAEIAPAELADTPIELRAGTGSAVIRNAPLGVILGVMPWNFPFYQVARFAGPNLAIGNSVLLKPASQCPHTGRLIQQIYTDAGAPEGAFEMIFADSAQIATVIADPRVQGVSLTGSERAGIAVAEQAARHLKKVVLELGGADPFIVLSTDDLAAVVTDLVNGRLDNNGQSCNAPKRAIVASGLYQEFTEKLVAALGVVQATDPLSDGAELGPVSSLAAAENLEAQVKRAVAAGGQLLLGGTREGAFFAPTVIAGIPRDSDVFQEEMFGPVALVYEAADEDEAVAIANDTPFGLGSYLYSTDPEQIQRVANQIDAGMVFVNCVLADGAELPFGGVKRSGFGREMGTLGATEFVNKKLIRIV
ncbi:MAG: NAD-dependent succinate-semialdehyde dehydrogenase [Propionicimonas sp.]|uniref:NAD-dependent succinate-semialdehyde dehydrogenase n=1 Tax=Propionicimonas sp. TaxID=1955623 RepID=UPI003D0F8F36